MKLNKIIILISVVILFLVVFSIMTNKSSSLQKACIENKSCFNIEIADTANQRATGLSMKKFLNKGDAMLFIFPEKTIPGFWMKDMKFPIDIIWINESWKITGIEKNMQPCEGNLCPLVYPKEKIMYVLEINSGLSDKYGFKDGDSVHLEQ